MTSRPQGDAVALASLKRAPLAAPPKAEAKAVLDGLREAAGDCPELMPLLRKAGPARDLVVAACALSPFLLDTARGRPGALARALTRPLDAEIDALTAAAREAWQNDDGTPAEEAVRHGAAAHDQEGRRLPSGARRSRPPDADAPIRRGA